MNDKQLAEEYKVMLYYISKSLDDEDLQLFLNEVCNIRSERSNKKIFRKIVRG